MNHPAQTKDIAAGRRWGKTILGGCIVANVLRQHGHAAWVVPFYKNGRALWRWIQMTCAPLATMGLMDISKSDRVITTHRGGFFGMFSGDNIDAIRSEWFHVVVEDEAARLTEEADSDAIDPTLADADGQKIRISTPRGRNWWWIQYQRGLADMQSHASWRMPTNGNPLPNIQKAFGLASERVSERTFRQEWLAEFIEDGAGVFRGVRAHATAQQQEQAIEDHSYVMGVDWGRTNDATVFKVIDTTLKAEVYSDRMTQTDYGLQTTRLRALWERFGKLPILAEANSIGRPLIEQLQNEGIDVQAFDTTNATKAQIVDALALAFERGEISILNDAVTIGELEAYESERLPSGLIRYGAPTGMHDDTVMALALAWSAALDSGPSIRVW